MKLWYQSMSRQAEWGGYPAVLRAILDKVKDPDTEIHVAGITQMAVSAISSAIWNTWRPARF